MPVKRNGKREPRCKCSPLLKRFGKSKSKNKTKRCHCSLTLYNWTHEGRSSVSGVWLWPECHLASVTELPPSRRRLSSKAILAPPPRARRTKPLGLAFKAPPCHGPRLSLSPATELTRSLSEPLLPLLCFVRSRVSPMASLARARSPPGRTHHHATL